MHCPWSYNGLILGSAIVTKQYTYLRVHDSHLCHSLSTSALLSLLKPQSLDASINPPPRTEQNTQPRPTSTICKAPVNATPQRVLLSIALPLWL